MLLRTDADSEPSTDENDAEADADASPAAVRAPFGGTLIDSTPDEDADTEVEVEVQGRVEVEIVEVDTVIEAADVDLTEPEA